MADLSLTDRPAKSKNGSVNVATACSVLVVDDDDVAVESVVRSFRKHNVPCETVSATDGAEALAILQGHHPKKSIKPPFVVLLDINMPGMDGFQMLEHLRSDPVLQRTVVFMLSTSLRDQDLHRAWDEHVAGYMVKSAVGPQFARLATFIKQYTSTQELP